ncbi:D(2) dopamine receptor A-like [Gigantopelta aegis]|uniref:D(2) dopamine receptor A-like n=1 Tax=Gigantopelta aegis TaxID=1735272 RepID=UPI001B88A843|nr:D(2) dopamine receptor A-like [Gigantopelta aegis]
MSIKPYTGQNYTDVIEKLNYERMLFELPVIVVIGVIMAVSVFGNSLVVYVYKSKYKKRTSSYFIMVLAVVDLCSSLCIPFVVFDLANPYMHPVPVVCKINRFMEVFSSTSSGLVLVCIAFDRYFHVCHPLRVYSRNQAQSLTIVMVALAASVSWPMLFLAGRKTAPTPLPGVFGDDCSYRDGMGHSVYMLLFQSGLFLMFSLTFCIALVFYSKIFYVICKRKYTTIGEKCTKLKEETSLTESTRNSDNNIGPNSFVFVVKNTITPNKNTNTAKPNEHLSMQEPSRHSHPESNESEDKTSALNCSVMSVSTITNASLCERMPVVRSFEASDNNTSALTNHSFKKNSNSSVVSEPAITNASLCERMSSQKSSVTSRKNASRMGSRQIRTTRTTVVLGMITLSTLIGFLPYLTVSLMMNFSRFFQPGMSSAEDLTYEFCSKSFFLNAAVNPVIYSALNPVFRRESVALLKKFPGMFLRSNHPKHPARAQQIM